MPGREERYARLERLCRRVQERAIFIPQRRALAHRQRLRETQARGFGPLATLIVRVLLRADRAVICQVAPP